MLARQQVSIARSLTAPGGCSRLKGRGAAAIRATALAPSPCLSEKESKNRYEDLDAALDSQNGCAVADAVAEVWASAETLIFDRSGRQLVLRTLALATPEQIHALARGLRGIMRVAVWSPHACAVLEKIVQFLSTQDAVECLARQLAGLGPALAFHVNGCQLMCRLIEYTAADPWTAALVDEVVGMDVVALCCHKFGRFVAVSILSSGRPEQRSKVVAALLSGNLARLARHRFAAHTVEHALLSEPLDRESRLAVELLRVPGAAASLACHPFGVHVVRALLQLPQAASQAGGQLFKAQRRLRKDRYGTQVADELGFTDLGAGSGGCTPTESGSGGSTPTDDAGVVGGA